MEDNTFGRELEHVGDNADVSILHQDIRVNQKCKIIRKKTDRIGIDQVCHIQHLIDTRVIIGAQKSLGSTSQDVGAGVLKVAVLCIGCYCTDNELQVHCPGKILHHACILMDCCGFMWDRCNLSDVVWFITVINVVSGSINIFIVLP